MQSKCTELTSMFVRFVLSFMVALAVFAGTLGQAYANDDLSAMVQSGTHEIMYACDNCNQDEPDDSDIEEMLELVDETDDSAVRPIPYGQGS